MAKYITHHRFKGLALCGKELNIPYGTELEENNHYLFTKDGFMICSTTSENAKLHFSINDDGQGLRRGKLTYFIAYSNRKTNTGKRFTEREINILKNKWAHFLNKNVPVILFNEEFFTAHINELELLANDLQIKIRR